jgi:hypothetical protein
VFTKAGFNRREAGLGFHHQGACCKWGISFYFPEVSGEMSGDLGYSSDLAAHQLYNTKQDA